MEVSKLIYGTRGQVRFENEQEKQEALAYLATSQDVELRYERNDEQGAWAPEKRILFRSETGVPEGLKRNWTAGTGNIVGRINAGDLYDEVAALRADG